MADLTRTIEILFEGTNRTGTAISSVGRELDELNYRVGTVAKPFADLSGQVAKLDAALIALAGAGLTYAFNESSKLQTAFTELAKVAGDNVEALDDAKDASKELSNTYGEAASDILASTANYVQAGFTIEEALGLAKTGMDLVIAGGVEAAESSEILIAALKGFKAPASEAGRLLDILNEVSNNYATDIKQLGTGMAAISPIARTMGLTMEETAGILTPVIEVFRSGDEAAVALKTGLLKLIDDTEPVKKALESIGVSQLDANGALRSGKDILLDVSTAFQDLDENQKLFVTQQLVGINQAGRMVEVFDNLATSTQITATAMGSVGSAAREVAVRLQDPEVAVNRLIQGFKNLSSTVGDEFQASGISFINGFTDIFKAIDTSVQSGAFDPIFDALNDFLNGIADNLKTIAKNLPEALAGVDFSGFIRSIGAFKDTIGGVFDGIDFSKPEDLESAIQKVIDTFETLADFSTGLADVFLVVFRQISTLIDGINSFSSETKQAAGSITGIGAVISAVTGPIGSLATAITGIGKVMQVLAAGQVAGLVKSLVGSGGLTSALAVVQAHPLIAAASAGVAIGTAWRKLTPAVDEAAQSVLSFIDKYTNLFGVEAEHKRIQEDSIVIQERWNKIMADRADATVEAEAKDKNYFLSIVDGAEKAVDGTESLTEQLIALGVLVEEPKTVTIDTDEAVEQLQRLDYFRESTGTWETIHVPIDISGINEAKQALDDIPAEKRLKIEADVDIERIKAQSEIIQNSVEWKAKLEIAEVEAGVERLQIAAQSITDTFTNTGAVIGDLFAAWDGETGLQEKWALQDAINAEQERRDRALDMQENLMEAEIANLNARTDLMKSGEATINVSGDGLQPHLEAIMWEIFAAIQVRAHAEGLDSLLLGG